MVNQDLGGLEELKEVLEVAVAHGACHAQKDEEPQAQSVHLGVEALEDEGRGQLMGHPVHEGAEEEWRRHNHGSRRRPVTPRACESVNAGGVPSSGRRD